MHLGIVLAFWTNRVFCISQEGCFETEGCKKPPPRHVPIQISNGWRLAASHFWLRSGAKSCPKPWFQFPVTTLDAPVRRAPDKARQVLGYHQPKDINKDLLTGTLLVSRRLLRHHPQKSLVNKGRCIQNHASSCRFLLEEPGNPFLTSASCLRQVHAVARAVDEPAPSQEGAPVKTLRRGHRGIISSPIDPVQ